MHETCSKNDDNYSATIDVFTCWAYHGKTWYPYGKYGRDTENTANNMKNKDKKAFTDFKVSKKVTFYIKLLLEHFIQSENRRKLRLRLRD